MEKWFVAAKKADFNKIAEEFGISPVLARIIRNRDVIENEAIRKFLMGSKKDLYAPELLKNMNLGVTILQETIATEEKIRVIGDYDVDGICATHILRTGLKMAGADVDVAIPHRMKDGYGLNENLIQEAHAAGIQLIVTCDNGIAAASQIAQAKALGMKVLVTDHHEVPFTEENGVRKELLPPADCVIDPKQEGCEYPFPGICGAVVAMKLMQALFEKMKPDAGEVLLNKLLPFAAMATVCDVMELLDENRIIVAEGLRMLRVSACCGLRALMLVNGLEPASLNAYHVGFVMGPCLNATGRLDTAVRALELLESENQAEAMTFAGELKELNDSRKTMTAKGVEQAIELIEKQDLHKDKVLVVYLPDCHESLAGIIAGRLRERYGKPVFVLTDSEEGVKGSGRSIDAYHMYEEMNKCKECFTKFGGHKMAAGLSLEKENIENLRQRLNESCTLTEEDYIRKIHIDVPMPISYANMELAAQLELLQPYGVGNQKPLFAQKNVVFLQGRKMGANQNFAKFTVLDDKGRKKEMVYFGDLQKFHDFLRGKFGEKAEEALYSGRNCNYEISVTYQVDINSFKGRESVQLLMQNFC